MEDAGIYARSFEELDCAIQLGVASGQVINVTFPNDAPPDATSDHPLLDRIADYLAGNADHFDDVPVALTVPTDQRRVLDALRKLPHGETVSVSRVAQLASLDSDDDEDVETVQNAIQANPVPLFIPDHRVEGFDGSTPSHVAERLRAVEQ